MQISRGQDRVGDCSRKIRLYGEKGDKDVGWRYGKEARISQKIISATQDFYVSQRTKRKYHFLATLQGTKKEKNDKERN